MNEIMRKLTSRKFLLALVGVVSGLAMAFGVEGGEITEMVSTIAGVVTMLGSTVAYIAGESKVDAAGAGKDLLVIPEGVETDDAESEVPHEENAG